MVEENFMLLSQVNAVVTSFMKTAFWDLTARKADVARFCHVWRHGPPVSPANTQLALICLRWRLQVENWRHSNYNFSMLQPYDPTRALLFAVGRESTKASHVLLNLLCHVSQDNIVMIVNGSEIAQYIQIFSETTQASG